MRAASRRADFGDPIEGTDVSQIPRESRSEWVRTAVALARNKRP